VGRVAVDFGVGQGASAMPISAAISAKRATPASAEIDATPPGAKQNGGWRRRSLVTARSGDAPHSLLAIRPSASTRDPFQYFNSLLGQFGQTDRCGGVGDPEYEDGIQL
jgi:hypothetical protein